MARKTLHRKARKNRRTRRGGGYPDKRLVIRIPEMNPKNAQTIKKKIMDTDFFQESLSEIPGLALKVFPSEKLILVVIPDPKGRAGPQFDADDMLEVFEELEDLTFEVVEYPSGLGKRPVNRTNLAPYNQYYHKVHGPLGTDNNPRSKKVTRSDSTDESMT